MNTDTPAYHVGYSFSCIVLLVCLFVFSVCCPVRAESAIFTIPSGPSRLVLDSDCATNLAEKTTEAKYRALLIGQTYQGIEGVTLTAPQNDVFALSRCLFRFLGTPYEITIQRDLTADEILSAIDESLGCAKNNDISLFYYSGHGLNSADSRRIGALLGNDGCDYVTVERLLDAFDQISGKKIIIIDACYSGSFIPNRDLSFMPQKQDNQDGMANTDDRIPDECFIITASGTDEKSYDRDADQETLGRFTYAFCRGCGYNCSKDEYENLLADQDLSHAISFTEILKYTQRKLLIDGQHVQGFPSDGSSFDFLRE